MQASRASGGRGGQAGAIPALPADVVSGPGPRWFRRALVALAGLYFLALVRHPPQWRGLRVAGFFTESTCLFSYANLVTGDYRLDAWSCKEKAWEPIDPRAYFPIQADDKESRFQRFGYFYSRNRPSLEALDAFIEERHPLADDGLTGAIGGIRLGRIALPIPPVGSPIEPYVYRPLDKPPPEQRKELYNTIASKRRARCTWAP